MTITTPEKTWARRRAADASPPVDPTPQTPSDTSQSADPAASTMRPRLARLFRGNADDPRGARPGLIALLALAAVVYCWNLTNSGYANDFYAAAVKSGTKSWEAWFFGSLDSSNAITVDKPPASLWLMGLSARLFGFSSFSLLIPQALMGIATVALTYATVRRWSGYAAGLLAGLLVTLTPVAALMFRFDNPDALLVLLMTAAAYFVTRAIETSRGRSALRWLVGAGLLIGFAFLTKMLQGLLVLPGLGLAYLVAAQFSFKKRIVHLGAAMMGVLVGSGWLIAVEALWPASARPYIGGSTNNSLWDLAIGYNGLGRIFGGSGNAGGMGGGGGGFGGTPGLLRMFNSQFGGEISWLLPAAFLLVVAGLVARGRAPRTDRVRAALIMWGGWLIVTMACLSFMEGTVHSYYAVALAPAIAACIAVGGRTVWERRASVAWRCVLAVSVCATAAWSFQLLSKSASSWMPWLRWVSLVVAVLGAVTFVAAHGRSANRMRRAATIGLIVGVLGALGGSSAWTLSTITTGHTGSMPASGPVASAGTMGAGGGAPGGGSAGGQSAARAKGAGANGAGGASKPGSSSGQAPTGSRSSGGKPSGPKPAGAQPGGQAPVGAGPGSSTQSGLGSGAGSAGASQSNAASGSAAGGAPSGHSAGTQGSPGGSANAAVTKLLNSTTSTWSAAVIGDQTAAGYILNSDTAVM